MANNKIILHKSVTPENRERLTKLGEALKDLSLSQVIKMLGGTLVATAKENLISKEEFLEFIIDATEKIYAESDSMAN